MNPCAPTIVEDLSVCSREIRLRGQITGATVEAFVDGDPTPIMRANASWPDEWYAFRPGVTLSAGQNVRVMQTLSGMKSAASTDPATVQAASTTLPFFVAPLVACSSIALVDGLAPGATVDVVDAIAANVGGVVSPSTRCVVKLTRAVNSQEVLSVTSTACSAPPGAAVKSLPAENMPALGKPKLDLAIECQRVLHFSSVQPGAVLKLRRSAGIAAWTCSAPELNARISPPLVKDETLEYWQEPPSRGCLREPGKIDRTNVIGGPPNAPTVVTRPCPGSKWIRLTGLIPSAIVKVLVDGAELCQFEAADAVQTVDLAGFSLSPGQKLSAMQGLCDNFSAASPVPSWVTAPIGANDVHLPSHLYGCGGVVRVAGISGPARVVIDSTKLKGRIGYELVDEGTADIPVAPSLIPGDQIVVSVQGCATAILTTWVEGAPDIPPFDVAQPRENDVSVRVAKVIPGCHVDVVVDGHWAGSAITGGQEARVPLLAPLKRHQKVQVTVRLCAQVRTAHEVEVIEAFAIHWSRPSPCSLQNGTGHYMSGRVTAALLWPDRALLGTEAGGLWLATPAGVALSLSLDWDYPFVLSLARGNRGPEHVYCGTTLGLLESDVSQPLPMLGWVKVTGTPFPGGPGATIQDILVLDNLLFIATDKGLWWSTIPASAGTPYAWQTDPIVAALSVQSICEGPDRSVVGYSTGKLFVGGQNNGAYSSWTDVTPTAGAPDPRLAQVAQRMVTGRLASCQTDRTRVCAIVSTAAKNGDANDELILAMLRSDDGGKTWIIPYADPDLTKFQPGHFVDMGFQAYRNIGVAINPHNRDAILLLARRSGALGSIDGGVTWDKDNWPNMGDTFHADTLCHAFDPTDPNGNTLLVGSDGGAFLSRDFGKSWNTDYNPMLCTLMFAWTPKLSLSASPGIEGLVVGAFQDNGKAYLPADGEAWRVLGRVGDGETAMFVTDDVVMSGGNDTDHDLLWTRWNGQTFEPEIKIEPAGFVGGFMPYMSRIPFPQRKDTSGALMIAVGCDDGGSGKIRGLFDRGSGHQPLAERFLWTELGTVTATSLTTVASFSGRTVLAGGFKDVGGIATPYIFLLDTMTSVVVEVALPFPGSAISPRWLAVVDETTAFVLYGYRVYKTNDLLNWTLVLSSMGLHALLYTMAVDRDSDPPRLIVGGKGGIWTSRDAGNTWDATFGNPVDPSALHLEVVSYPSGRRVCHMGTWNWGLWRAELT